MERKYPGDIKNLALKIKGDLTHAIKRIKIAGSIRRKVASPRDIDILIIPANETVIRQYFKRQGEVTSSGSHKLNADIDGVSVNILLTDVASWGAALMYFTGPKGANINNRRIAIHQGFTLNEYGLFYKNGKRVPGTSTERQIYKELGKAYRRPEDRGNPR